MLFRDAQPKPFIGVNPAEKYPTGGPQPPVEAPYSVSKSRGIPKTTGRFDSRYELEKFVYDECITKKRAQTYVAQEAGVSTHVTHDIIKGFYGGPNKPRIKLTYPTPVIDAIPTTRRPKTAGIFASRQELEQYVFNEHVNKKRKITAIAKDAGISPNTVYSIIKEIRPASTAIEPPDF